jgi:hypothetical protein
MNSIIRDEFMNMSISPQKCSICHKTYLTTKDYEAHNEVCSLKFEIIHNPKRHITDTLMIKKENMDITVNYLLENVLKMQQRINELEKIIKKEKKKINIVDWLNTNVSPTITFQEWYHNISLDESHMFLVAENNFQTGVMSILKQLLPIDNEDKVPMRSYHENKNIIYVYVQNKEQQRYWMKMTSTQLDLVIKNISKRLILLLFEWKEKRETELKCVLEDMDEEHKRYANYKSKILSNDNEIYRPLYEYLKMRLSGAVEYEFTWN